ncbi:MAG: UDP-glucose--hexose-1-phosphate uridylyltransferase [Oscillospiraceae bacterium]
METGLLIERLLQFGEKHHFIGRLDKIVARNTLLDLFCLAQPYDKAVPNEELTVPTEILDALVENAGEAGLFDKDISALAINFEARIMGAIMPRQSEVEAQFAHLRDTKGITAATDYFYDLCVKANYIRTAQIAKNIKWDYPCKYGSLEITINLTKPEKDPKTIAMERLAPSVSYPKCMLCIDNIGYAGRVNFPARQTHRVVPITLTGEQWYLQYSPYVYYNEHCIIFSEKHEPMSINAKSFAQIFDFVTQYPHYTCGSNADLPIVGGSILSHTHFQGGKYVFPMQNAKELCKYTSDEYKELKFATLKWPVSTLRVTGKDKTAMLRFAESFLLKWREYTDESAEVLAYTVENGEKTPHNTVTPILHYTDAEGYVLDLVPRNNRTSKEFPEGIFHPHREIHHIKKENIGLIEVMGLAILPSRLKAQSELVAGVLTSENAIDDIKAKAPEHSDWIDELTAKFGTNSSKAKADEIVKSAIGAKFEACLEHAGVYKQTQEGSDAFTRFLSTLGLLIK